jgi:hypothetical protein
LLTVSGLAKVAIFTIPNAFGIDPENQTLIYHDPDSYRDVCGALNRSRQQRDAQCLFSFDYDFVYFLHNSICFCQGYN